MYHCPTADGCCVLYNYVADIDFQACPLSRYEGKVSLIVNVASETPTNYKQLVELQDEFPQSLRVLAFPSNVRIVLIVELYVRSERDEICYRMSDQDFGFQEPGSEDEIKRFAESYNVNFKLFAKVHCNSGLDYSEDPLYTYLKASTGGGNIRWNFEKIITDKRGVPQVRAPPKTDPQQLEDDVRKLITA